MQTNDQTPRHPVVAAGGRVIGHAVAIVVGLILMFTGLALGVTMVMLPVGIPLGLAGLLLVIWGGSTWARTSKTLP
jgi:hypothetical protein